MLRPILLLRGTLLATYLCHVLKGLDTQLTRLAGGVPVGSELEYANPTTVAHDDKQSTTHVKAYFYIDDTEDIFC